MIGRTFARTYSSGPAILSTLLLLRTPVITADLPRFEQQYYNYQKELWKRLMWTFPKWFYFREGSLAEQKYRELNKNPAFNNPNIEFPEGRPEIRQQRDRRFKQEIKVPKTYTEGADGEAQAKDSMSRKIVPNLRITKADELNDTSSLERKLARTLYLVVSEDGKKWKFPTFANSGKPLHLEAEEGLYLLGGDHINYFNVSSKPCHVHNSSSGKEFFIKLHILSGEFSPKKEGLKHAWLTVEEVGQHLDELYFEEVRHLMSLV